MTTIALPRQHHSRLPLGKIIRAVIFLAAVIYCAHALAKHGADAAAVRQCAESQEPVARMQKFNSSRVHCLYVMDDGKTGDQLRQPDATGQEFEISSFIRWEQSLEETIWNLLKEAFVVPPGG